MCIRDRLYTAFFDIEQPNDVLALDGSKGYAGGMAYINAFFDQVLGNPPCPGILGNIAKGSADDGAQPAEGRVDQELAPAHAHKIVLHFHRAHMLQDPLYQLQSLGSYAFHGAHAEGKAVGFRGQLGYAGRQQGSAPGDGTAYHPILSNQLGDGGLRNAVLQGADQPRFSQIGL